MGEPTTSNFTRRIPAYKKAAYQDGTENDTKFICKNGIVTVSFVFEYFDSLKYCLGWFGCNLDELAFFGPGYRKRKKWSDRGKSRTTSRAQL